MGGKRTNAERQRRYRARLKNEVSFAERRAAGYWKRFQELAQLKAELLGVNNASSCAACAAKDREIVRLKAAAARGVSNAPPPPDDYDDVPENVWEIAAKLLPVAKEVGGEWLVTSNRALISIARDDGTCGPIRFKTKRACDAFLVHLYEVLADTFRWRERASNNDPP